MTIEPAAFREAMSQYPTGVVVLAIADGGGIQGMTIGSFTSLSLTPPLVLLCVGKQARMGSLLAFGRLCSINVLRADQQALSTYYAGSWKGESPPPHRFVPWGHVHRMEGAALALSCTIAAVLDGGDHYIVTLEVGDRCLGLPPREPLIFHDRRYRRIDPSGGEDAPDLDRAAGGSPAQLFHDAWE